jgi:hypothetical protein
MIILHKKKKKIKRQRTKTRSKKKKDQRPRRATAVMGAAFAAFARERLLQREALFRDFVSAWLPFVRALPPPSIATAGETDRVAVIVETREHYALEFCVRVVAHFLGPAWGMHVLCGEDNAAFVRAALRDLEQIRVTQIRGVHVLDVRRYNALCLSSQFWRALRSEHVLIFQCDALMLRPGIERFMCWDYIGAPATAAPVAIRGGVGADAQGPVQVMNGGFSLRRRSAMLRCLRRIPVYARTQWEPGTIGPVRRRALEWEDCYFCRALATLGAALPPRDVQAEFSVESVFHPAPLGFHKPWRYLPRQQVCRLLDSIDWEYCCRSWWWCARPICPRRAPPPCSGATRGLSTRNGKPPAGNDATKQRRMTARPDGPHRGRGEGGRGRRRNEGRTSQGSPQKLAAGGRPIVGRAHRSPHFEAH